MPKLHLVLGVALVCAVYQEIYPPLIVLLLGKKKRENERQTYWKPFILLPNKKYATIEMSSSKNVPQF